MCQYSAETMKALVIDWLLTSQSTDIIIGNEVMYGTKRKVVDLMAIINNKIIAIEIKSSSDNLNRLSEQIKEYNKVFDKIIIISAPSHIEKIKTIIDKGVGLYVINNNITKVLNPLVNHNHDKLEMLHSVSSVYLKKRYPQHKNMNSYELRSLLSKEKKGVLHELLISFYQQRLYERFYYFMNERGKNTHIDDIPTLSSLTRIELF